MRHSLARLAVLVGLTVQPSAELLAQDMDLELVSRISGQGGNDGELYLNSILRVQFTSDTTILIQDRAEFSLLEVSLEGSLLNRIGREGGGPGEFRSIHSFGFVGDTLWVLDPDARRVTWFVRNSRGAWAPARDSTVERLPQRFLAGGGAVYRWPRGDSIEFRLVGPADSKGILLGKLYSGSNFVQVVIQGEQRRLPNPVSDLALDTYAGGEGAALVSRRRPRSRNERPTFRVVRYWNGETTVRDIPFTPTLDEGSVQEAIDHIAGQYYEGLGKHMGWSRSEIVEAYRQVVEIPKFASPVRRAILDSAGRLWLAREELEGDLRWQWLDRDLEVGGEFAFPADRPLYDIDHGLAVAVTHDEYDVPRLSVFRVRGLPSRSQ